jgi:hypothetical protein
VRANLRLALEPGRERHFRYELSNDRSEPVEVLCAIPVDGPDQTVLSHEVKVTTDAGGTLPHGRVALPDSAAVSVTLPRAASLRSAPGSGPGLGRSPRSTPPTPPGAPDVRANLTAEQREEHLRESPSAPLAPSIRAEASAITAQAVDTLDQTRLLFQHLTGGIYRYKDSPSDHGAEACVPPVRAPRPTSRGCSSRGAAAWASRPARSSGHGRPSSKRPTPGRSSTWRGWAGYRSTRRSRPACVSTTTHSSRTGWGRTPTRTSAR